MLKHLGPYNFQYDVVLLYHMIINICAGAIVVNECVFNCC